MKKASDYIIFPLDVPTIDDAKKFVELLADDIGIFKVGLELFIRSGPDIIEFIHSRSDAQIFLDLKLHDIPATVGRAMARIVEFGIAFATVHVGETRRMLEAAVEASKGQVGILGVTVLTSVSPQDLKSAGYREELYTDMTHTVIHKAKLAREAGCTGVICSGHEAQRIKKEFGNDFFAVTPGIRPAYTITANEDQQRIMTPAQAIQNGSDYLVVGRPIRDADDPRQAVLRIAEEIERALIN